LIDIGARTFSGMINAELVGHLFEEDGLHGWDAPTDAWSCHCCNRVNDKLIKTCTTCGRPATYGELRHPKSVNSPSTKEPHQTRVWINLSLGQNVDVQKINVVVDAEHVAMSTEQST